MVEDNTYEEIYLITRNRNLISLYRSGYYKEKNATDYDNEIEEEAKILGKRFRFEKK
jgi:hypothetical protein